VSPGLKSMRAVTTLDLPLRSMSIGPGTSAAAIGVTIGSDAAAARRVRAHLPAP
jgi:hypothetical protein